MAKQVWIENGIIVFYGNRAGYVREGYAVADPVFHTSELEGFLKKQGQIRDIVWEERTFELLESRKDIKEAPGGVKRVRVWQLDPGVDIEMKFISYAETKRLFGEPDRVKYRIVYDGIAKTDDLESLYYAFQAELRKDTGHVLSVSDVLELYDGHGSTFYYVDQIGFVQIPFEGAEPGDGVMFRNVARGRGGHEKNRTKEKGEHIMQEVEVRITSVCPPGGQGGIRATHLQRSEDALECGESKL